MQFVTPADADAFTNRIAFGDLPPGWWGYVLMCGVPHMGRHPAGIRGSRNVGEAYHHCMPPTLAQRIAACQRPVGRRPVMYQSWRDLLFLHWAIEPAIIQATLPAGLTVDTFDGRAYLGVVPFYMCDVRPRCCPAASQLMRLANFLEMNVRTYVHDERGTPGVWFYSLDANQKLAVRVARRFFHLPYFDAKMNASRDGDRITYQCTRKNASAGSQFEYRPTVVWQAEHAELEPASLEYFLVERYVLFAHDAKRDRLFSGRVHHRPYPLHQVDFQMEEVSAIAQAGFDACDFADRQPDHAVMSRGVDVDVFGLERI